MKASHQAPTPGPQPLRLARYLLALVLTLGAAVPALAQQHPSTVPPAPTDTVRHAVELPPATLDSLAAVIEVPAPAVDSVRLLWLQTPATLAERVSDRMACLETAAPHQCNAAVLAYVRLFTERQRSYTQHVLEREQFYFPTFEKYLTQYNLPPELKYLSVVESALIPTAKSPVGAVGLWQFMPGTGADMRLRRDEWVDERMHPEKSTEAACKYLRDLYREFHDWELVLAAYNWGSGNVRRAMRRTGKRNFWDLYPHLPAETRNYVPTFTAIMYAMKYAPEHGLHDPALRYQSFEALDTLALRGQALDLRRLSRALGYADSLAVGRYNPEVRRGSLPAGYRPYVLRYPSAARPSLAGIDRATLLTYCQPLTDLPRPLPLRPARLAGVEPWPVVGETPAAVAASPTVPHPRRIYYTVRRGQTLAAVAEKFDVAPARLRRWNDLRPGQALRPGRELVILLPSLAAPAPAPLSTPLPTPTPAPVVALAATPARPAANLVADSVARALTAANRRYAEAAQASAAREADQRQALQRARQQAARVAAGQQRATFRAAALAKAAAAQEQARRAALADAEPVDAAPDPAPDPATHPDTAAPAAPVRPRRAPNPVASRSRPPEPAALLAKVPTAKTPVAVVAKAPVAPAPAADYTVQPGDNLTQVAHTNNLSVAQVKAWNNLVTGEVQAGQRLRLCAPAAAAAAAAAPVALEKTTHTVQPGDTLYNISRRFQVSVAELMQLNHLSTPDVKLGQKLLVRG